MLIYIVHILLLHGGLFSDNATIHDFHISKCDINYSVEESALQISLHVFLDDLELALSGEGFENLGLCTGKETDTAEQIMFEYIQKHLKIVVDEQPIEIKWVGKELSGDLAAVWAYLEITNIKPRQSIQVQNDMLISYFEDQQNIVQLKFSKNKKSFFLFNYKQFSGRLDLQ